MQTIEQTLVTRAKIEALKETYRREMAKIEQENVELVQKSLIEQGFSSMRIDLATLIFVFSRAMKHESIPSEMDLGYISSLADQQRFFKQLETPGTDLQKLFAENLTAMQEGLIAYYQILLKERGAFYDEEHKKIVMLSRDLVERDQQLAHFIEGLRAKIRGEIQKQQSESHAVDASGRFKPISLTQEEISKNLSQLRDENVRQTNEKERLAEELMSKQEACKQRYLCELDRLPPIPFDRDLIDAVISGNLEKLIGCLKQDKNALNRPLYNASQSIYGKTLLYLACEYGQLPIIEYLLGGVGKEKARLDISDQSDGYFPIHAVFMRKPDTRPQRAEEKWGNPDVLKRVLDLLETVWREQCKSTRQTMALVDLRGAYNRTPLHTAVFFNNPIGLEWLFLHGAERHLLTREVTPQGLLPFHCIIKFCSIESAEVLLHHHANPHDPNEQGESALIMAHYQRHGALIQLFTKYGYSLSENELHTIQRLMERRYWRGGPTIEEMMACEQRMKEQMLSMVIPRPALAPRPTVPAVAEVIAVEAAAVGPIAMVGATVSLATNAGQQGLFTAPRSDGTRSGASPSSSHEGTMLGLSDGH